MLPSRVIKRNGCNEANIINHAAIGRVILLFKLKYFLSQHFRACSNSKKLLAGTDQQVGLQYLVRTHVGAHPVVQVEMKAFVTDTKLELLEETLVFHRVQCREEVTAFLQMSKRWMFFLA